MSVCTSLTLRFVDEDCILTIPSSSSMVRGESFITIKLEKDTIEYVDATAVNSNITVSTERYETLFP